MSDYDLYYWSVPFRGQFVRAVLAFAGKRWTEKGDAAIAQMPAIVLYLGETLDLLPKDAAARALTLKLVNDANDVIDELTLDGGKQMWTPKRWAAFVPRLKKWMSFFEETGRRHGLTPDGGFILGGEGPGVADVVTAVLWSTMADRFDAIAGLLQEAAPMTAALTRRTAALEPLARLAAQAREDYGDAYCGGRIEASLRKVLAA